MSKTYDAVIIGGGLGGLASASLLARQGKKVLVLEKHAKPGGYASNFKRGDFTFDVALHAINGITPGTPSYKCLEDCGVADKVTFIPQKSLYRLVGKDDEIVVPHGGVEQYKAFLGERFPAEKSNIERMFKEAASMFDELSSFIHSRLPFWLRFIVTPVLYPRLLRFDRDTVHDFFSRFTGNRQLMEILAAQWPYYGLPPDQLAYSYFSYPFFDYLAHGGFSIKGGSQMLANAFCDVIRQHGGKVALSSGAISINVEKGRVVGVVARKIGSVSTARVISNISPHETVSLVGEQAFPRSFLARLQSMRPAMSAFQIYIGLDCPISRFGVAEDEYSVFVTHGADSLDQFAKMCAESLDYEQVGWFLNFFSNVDPSLAPPGKSTLGIIALVSGNHWKNLSKEQYREKKQELVDALLKQAERRLPGLLRHIEVLEAGSPHTMTKYTGSFQGSINGFAQSVDQAGLSRRFPMRYPVKGLYHVGAWTFPGGGYVGAMLSARLLVDRFFPSKSRKKSIKSAELGAMPDSAGTNCIS